MRRLLIALLCTALLTGVVYLTVSHPETTDPTLYSLFTQVAAEETGAQNIVAAILLNYRMYDTVFEAMILLTSVMGMLHFLAVKPHGEDDDE